MKPTTLAAALVLVAAAVAEGGKPRDYRSVWIGGVAPAPGVMRVDLDSSTTAPRAPTRIQIVYYLRFDGGIAPELRTRTRTDRKGVTLYTGSGAHPQSKQSFRLRAKWVGDDLVSFKLRVGYRGDDVTPHVPAGVYTLADVMFAGVAR